jgi:hypothetical protein
MGPHCLSAAKFAARPEHTLWSHLTEWMVARTIYPDQGAELPIERVDEKDRVFFRAAGPPYLAAVRCDWGGRVNTTQGKKLMTKQEAQQQGFKVLESLNSIHTSKTVFKDSAAVCEPLGMVFEFVPVKSPRAFLSWKTSNIPHRRPWSKRLQFLQAMEVKRQVRS